jgi:hypothetical protein
MSEFAEDKADVIIALLAQLVAASNDGDPVIALTDAGVRQKDVARILGMKPNAVGMRITRAKENVKRKSDGTASRN